MVTVASNAHAQGRIDFDDLQGALSYSGGRAYSQSKLANVLFTYQLAERLRECGVTANALHPGVVRTSFGAEDPAHPATPGPVTAAGHEVAGPGRRDVNPPGVGSRTCAGVGPLLRQPETHEILHSQLRPGGRGTAVGGERGSGQPHRGTPCVSRRPQPDDGSLGAEDDSVAAGPTRPENNRVLIVDDHAPFRSIARQVLTADGFLIVGQAADGAEAIRACGELRPDLVLLDVQLPDVDGFSVAAVLTSRTDPPTVVLVSSRSRTEYGSRIEDCGARGYIAKAELSGDAVRRLLPLPNRVPPLDR